MTGTNGSSPAETPALIDLFCGAGGLATGFKQRGFTSVLASDIWRPAADTYVLNHPDHPFIQDDIRNLEQTEEFSKAVKNKPLVIAGGPPCQGFSSAGARRADDERNTLVSFYAELAARAQPDVIVFENVEGFLTADGGRFVLDLLRPLVKAGYQVRLEKHNVANFNVPQLRKRVIGIASRDKVPQPLKPTTFAHGMPGAELVGLDLPATQTVSQSLGGLKLDSEADPLAQSKTLSDLEQARVSHVPPGGTMRDLPPHLQHASWQKRANRRVADGMPTERRGGAPSGLRRLRGDQPSKAITSAAPREFIHPDKNRFLTPRECAVLQTFPEDYVFAGNKAAVNTLIGNAIPPLFAEAIADAVLRTLAQPLRTELKGGIEALSLTNSSGVSPALARTMKAVTVEFGETNASETTLF